MTWIKLQDNCPRHPKIAGLSDRAFRAWIGSLCYASEFLTDGIIPSVFMLSVKPAVREELVAAGLWKLTEDESKVEIHQYLEHQTSRADVDRERARNRARRGGTAGTTAGTTPGRTAERPPPENREQRTDTENRVQNAPKTGAARPLTARRNLNAEFEHPRFDVPTSWHLRHVKDLSDGEAGMLKFYAWLAERVERTNEDTIVRGVEHGRFVWLDRCFTEWGATRRAPAPSDALVEATKRRQAEMEAKHDPRFDGLTLREKFALAKELREAEAS